MNTTLYRFSKIRKASFKEVLSKIILPSFHEVSVSPEVSSKRAVPFLNHTQLSDRGLTQSVFADTFLETEVDFTFD